MKTGMLALMLLIPQLVTGQQANELIVDTLLKYSGFGTILEQIPEIIHGQYREEWQDGEPNADRDAAIEKLALAFDTHLLKKDARSAFLEILDPEKGEAVIAWMNRPEVVRLRVLESSLDEGVFDGALQAFLIDEKNMPSDERIQLFIDYDETIEATERTVQIVINLYLGMIRAINPYLSAEDQLPSDQIPQIVHFMYSDLYPTFLQNNLAIYAYIYRDVTDDEMKAYTAFYETETGVWYIRALSDVMSKVLENAGERAGLHLE